MKKLLVIFSLIGLIFIGNSSFSDKLPFLKKFGVEGIKGQTFTNKAREFLSKKFDFIKISPTLQGQPNESNANSLLGETRLNINRGTDLGNRKSNIFSRQKRNNFNGRNHAPNSRPLPNTSNSAATSSYSEFTRPYSQPTAEDSSRDEPEQVKADDNIPQEYTPPLDSNQISSQAQVAQSEQIVDFGVPASPQSPGFEIIDSPGFQDPERNSLGQNLSNTGSAGAPSDISGGGGGGVGFFSFGGNTSSQTNQNQEQTNTVNTQNTGQTSPSVPPIPPTVQRVVKISNLSIGYSHFCLITSGSLYCAGTNLSGEIGLPDSVASSNRLTKVSGMDGIVSISNGDQFSCALFDDSTASCFGDNTLNKLSTDESGFLVDAGGVVIEEISQISTGKDSACLVTKSGDLYCWGKNDAGQLGKTANTESNAAKKVVTAEKFKKVIISTEHACAINLENKLFCWGSNQFGKLGINQSGDRTEPTPVSEIGEVLDFSLGQNHTCAISKEGTSGRLYCWGSNDLGQLLSLEEKSSRKPVLLSTEKFTKVVATERAICAKGIDSSGSCWGEISFAGDGVYTNELTKYPGMESLSDVYGSSNGVCFTTKSNDLFCLGNNESKQYEQSLSSFITIPKKMAISGLK